MPQLFPSRTALLLATSAAITLGLGSCATTSPTSETESPESEVAATPEDSLQVVTTILPITQFTTAVAGDRAEVVQLLPTNVGPHEYQAKPGDAQAIANADVLVKNGLEMEFFLDDMVENAGNADLVVIDSSEGIATLASAGDHGHDHAKEDGHDHAEGEAHDHAEGEAHAEGEEHDHAGHGHAHGEFDPHVWLDPKRAIEQVENIRDGLIAADPGGEAEYTANAEAFIAELETLDTEITEKLAPFAGQTFVVFHDFAAYFADSYGLQTETLVGIPEENPSPEDVKRVMETVQAEGLKTILTEPQAGQESFDAIANDLNIKVSVFDPLETGPADAIQPDYYLNTMRQNADNLAASFEASNQAWLTLWVPQPAAVVPQRVGLRF
ncbi:Periplasmic binding protein component of an ABC type zinc uptake transporter [Halomicronema hongdechloris C2206]|uniref:Periplasmic binding protein component of an ABC type zinc uptake transporter n=1 Tax=Halomicronema hongdechloris C2206 TaxID=1641165 RepID=A0A1Z3HTR6_9CYAN|nr:zinc ABC transporter substrate-binding protein [Halomicronema hongdechloris]ASC73689.1 Periplasmic binding protein component of an ABC type zinc uptake transporter [Halomicronema hongdechloris C2206]